jgi:hypothetical protein
MPVQGNSNLYQLIYDHKFLLAVIASSSTKYDCGILGRSEYGSLKSAMGTVGVAMGGV